MEGGYFPWKNKTVASYDVSEEIRKPLPPPPFDQAWTTSDDGDWQLIDRIKGLEKVFGKKFYDVLADVLGEELFTKERKTNQKTKEEVSRQHDDEMHSSKLPKGFNKWDLKQIKLHESQSASGKQILVQYWSLKGHTDTGEILYNASKDLYYFRSQDSTKSTFALSDEQGRKSTREAKNYYFKVLPVLE